MESIDRQDVLKAIQAARHKVEAYSDKYSRLNAVLLVTNIALGALATGIAGISAAAQKAVVPGDNGWIITCGGVAVLTAFTTICAALHTIFKISNRVDSSEKCNARLEVLENQLTIMRKNANEVMETYNQIREEYAGCFKK